MAAPSAPAAEPAPAVDYALPTDQLNALAADAGLEWVNSDAQKIRDVQAVMAAEVSAPRLPRKPRPQVVPDEAPLVLVETRKDLAQMKLPFDPQQQRPSA